MNAEPLHREESTWVDATPEAVYDLVSDVTRTGEWSPVCTGCWWDDDAEAGTVGARFTGRNQTPQRTWETRSRVVAADRGRSFAWEVGEGLVRWGLSMAPEAGGTRLTETWHFLPAGRAFFAEKYGDRAPEEVAERTEAARTGIPRTLEAIRRIAEEGGASGTGGADG